MREKMNCRVAIIVMVAVAVFFSSSVVVPIFASTLEELREEQNKTEEELSDLNSQISGLAGEKGELEAQIGMIDDELVIILASMGMLEDQVEEKELEIEIAQVEYEAALLRELEQHDAMVVRIRLMYEQEDVSYTEIFTKVSNFSDILNKAEYVERLYQYDRELLEEYRLVKQEVATLKERLEIEQEELLTTLHEYESERAILDEMLSEKQSEADDYELMLAQARQQAAAYELIIEQQISKIQALEEEERRKAEQAAAAAGGSSGSSGGSSSGTANGSTIITNATGSALGKEIAMYAIRFVGNPYVLGGTSLTDGADCSGFTYAVYKDYGFSIPRTSTEQRSAGVAVTYDEAQPGDLICYSGHVALYIGGGQIVHASTPSTGIKYGTATYRPILAVRRIV